MKTGFIMPASVEQSTTVLVPFPTERWTGRAAVLELEVTFRRRCDVLP
jgi:hypothetical protein